MRILFLNIRIRKSDSHCHAKIGERTETLILKRTTSRSTCPRHVHRPQASMAPPSRRRMRRAPGLPAPGKTTRRPAACRRVHPPHLTAAVHAEPGLRLPGRLAPSPLLPTTGPWAAGIKARRNQQPPALLLLLLCSSGQAGLEVRARNATTFPVTPRFRVSPCSFSVLHPDRTSWCHTRDSFFPHREDV